MKTIVRIYYKSDFTVNMELPTGYDGQEFIIRLFVNDKSQYYEAKYIDGTCTNCVIDTENNVVNVYVDSNHNLPAGCLHILSAFDYNNNHFHDGVETIANVTETNIYLVKQNPNAVSAEFVASVLPDLTGSTDFVTFSDLEAASYATTTYVADYVATYGGNVDLSAYVTKSELNEAGYITSIPTEYITETELNGMGYATKNQLMFKQDVLVSGNNIKTINNESILGSGNLNVVTDLTGYVSQTDLQNTLNQASYVTNIDLSNKAYATEAYVADYVATYAATPDLTGYVTDTQLNQTLNSYATKAYVVEYVSEHSGDIDLSAYVTQTYLSSQSYVTENKLQAELSWYATEHYVDLACEATYGYAKAYVAEYVATYAPQVDLTGYATESYVANYVATYAPEPDLSAYVSKTELNNASYVTESALNSASYVTESALNQAGYLTSVPDNYVTQESLNGMGYITTIPAEYVTDSELDACGYVTASYVEDYVATHTGDVDLSAYAKLTDLNSYVSKTELNNASYATQTYVADYVRTNAPTPDLSAYVTHTELNNASYVSKTELNNAGYISSIPSEYITQDELSANGYLTSHQDLSGYVSKTELNAASYITMSDVSAQGYLTSIPSEYITQDELSANGYLTEHQSLADYVTYNYLSAQSYSHVVSITTYDYNNLSYAEQHNGTIYVLSDAEGVDFSAYVTKTELNSASYVSHAELNNASYVTKDELNQAGYISSIPAEYVTDSEIASMGYVTIGDVANMGYITSIPSEYITQDELSANGYLTSHQDLSAYVKLTDLNSYVSKTELNNASYVSHAELNSASYVTKTDLDSASYITHNEFNSAGYVTQASLSANSYITQTALSANSYGSVIELTQYDYDLLTTAQKNNGTIYVITDANTYDMGYYATKSYVANYVATYGGGGGSVDLSSYVTYDFLSAQSYSHVVSITTYDYNNLSYAEQHNGTMYVLSDVEGVDASYIATKSDLASYLPLTGGYLTGTTYMNSYQLLTTANFIYDPSTYTLTISI